MSLFKRFRLSQYTLVQDESDDSSDDDSDIGGDEQPWRPSTCELLVVLLLLSNVAWLVFSISVLPLWYLNSHFCSFSGGFTTDFVAARGYIQLSKVLFTGARSLDVDERMYSRNPAQVQYVGDASPEIDQAWEDLIGERHIVATEEEVKEQWPTEYQAFWNEANRGYMVGFSMLDTLQCLRDLRREFYPEYYNFSLGPDHIMHRDQCIEQIRQQIMCQGDMTPIPADQHPAINRNHVDSDHPHTCRNYDILHAWVKERNNGASAIQPRLRKDSRQTQSR